MSYKQKIASLIGRNFLPNLVDKIHTYPRVLFYHGVVDESKKHPVIQANQIPFLNFRSHIEFFKKKYIFISIDEFYDRLTQKHKFTGKEIVLTFDDGYLNNYEVVAPYLFDLKIPFTIFISPGLIACKRCIPSYYIFCSMFYEKIRAIEVPCLAKSYSLADFQSRKKSCFDLLNAVRILPEELVEQCEWDLYHQIPAEMWERWSIEYKSEQLMNWEQIVELSHHGVSIGSHCLRHCILHDKQKDAEVRRQLIASKQAIEEKLGHCHYFAYPNGNRVSVSHFAEQLSKETYKMSFAVTHRHVTPANNISFISRMSLCDDLYAAKTQFSMLSLLPSY